ncbi:hypothetical protein [Paenibacillus paeoniae]|uniref:Lipoprotein n=1 Tax=Paenibacillus paeoniae TaxID=2292705 RepID=A0A371P0N5_9BACL|nr:hypothetical protein [Paenibacillus paeoniae]REK69178.1 hypothetical protein DX130_25965 [Paenibacillus paeoniae]
MKSFKKKIIFGAFIVFLITSTAIVWANPSQLTPFWMKDADDHVNQSILEKQSADQTIEMESTTESSNEQYVKEAHNQTQVDQLLGLEKDKSLGIGVWKREALQIIGKLPKDQQRLTFTSAKEIINGSKSKDVIDISFSFNEIAGAPDWEGGSGISRTIYFTDEAKNEAIYILYNDIKHVFTDNAGNQVSISLLDENKNVSPSATQLPVTK